MVVSELRGEKIDIIPFNDEPARFVAKALSPARVREVLVDDDAKQATVIVPDDQLSLAIGREGQNARLAARLTGWRVDIRSETEFAAEEAEHGYEEEEVQGRCAAILSNGRRCPNASLPGSRYCGLESHQALASIDSDNVADLAPAASNGGSASTSRRPRGGWRADRRAAPSDEPTPPRRTPEQALEPSRRGRPPRSRRHSARTCRDAAASAVGGSRRSRSCCASSPASDAATPARRATCAVADPRARMPGRGAYLCRDGGRRAPAPELPGAGHAPRRRSRARCAVRSPAGWC